MPTPYHAKYFAYMLSRFGGQGTDQIERALFDACVDLNPHQIEAALFALCSPLSKGVLLADEVGLGKTIEAGLVLCQCWAEQKRNLIIIFPASLRKQWNIELTEKFNLPSIVLDAKTYGERIKEDVSNPFRDARIIIYSMHFAAAREEQIKEVLWDRIVINEAHKLRNAYRTSNRIGQAVRRATEERCKILLTATPLQNSLLELYGLSTLIDEQIQSRLKDTREKLLEHFDEDVHEHLKVNLNGIQERLDRIGQLFWLVTKSLLKDYARFNTNDFTFRLDKTPIDTISTGLYHLISKNRENTAGEFLYRLSHPLGEYVLESAKTNETPTAEVVFDMSRLRYEWHSLKN